MPKMKTHKGAASRFRVTKNGKLIRRRQGGGHLRRNKTKRMRRSYRKSVSSSVTSTIKMVKAIAGVSVA